MSPSRELWNLLRNTLLGTASVMSLVDDIFDKVPTSPWKGKQAYISRGPTYGNDDGADCIDGQEITLQLDVWSKANSTSPCSDIVESIRAAVHEQELELTEHALVQVRVEIWRIVDDPDPLVTHGIVQVVAMVEVPEGS